MVRGTLPSTLRSHGFQWEPSTPSCVQLSTQRYQCPCSDRYRHKVLSWKRRQSWKISQGQILLLSDPRAWPMLSERAPPLSNPSSATCTEVERAHGPAVSGGGSGAERQPGDEWGAGTQQGTGNVLLRLLLWMLPIYSAAISTTLLREKVSVR